MVRIPQCICASIAALALPFSASSQTGWYLGMELGGAIAPSTVVTGINNDWASRCDRITNPTQAETGDACAAAPPLATWNSTVNGGGGVAAGFALGYYMGRFRVEGEYSFRTAAYGGPSQVTFGGTVLQNKAERELEESESGAEDLTAHNLFVNLYYDFASRSRLTPYAGIGAGGALATLDYFSRWKRNDDPELITTFEDPLLRARLAGTTSIGKAKLSDVMFGYQVLAGVDYAASDRVAITVKARWTFLGVLEDGGYEWVQLRSHESDIGRGFRILQDLTADAVSAIGVGFGIRYRL